ncbi:MAG TPA: hypothetical protein VGM52_09690 [Herbaspirillum sp.]|jgi:hypothetical protein
MNTTTWKWILAANCLIASSASFAGGPIDPHVDARIGAHSAHAGVHSGIRNSLGDVRHMPKTVALDKSKFQYMDSAPIYNNHHVRAAVMVIERRPDKQSQCSLLKGEAKHHCYELSMPT